MTTGKAPHPRTQSMDGVYSGWLSGKGRLMFDSFVYLRSQDEPSYFIELDSGMIELFMEHVKKFKLRSKIFLEPEVWFLVFF